MPRQPESQESAANTDAAAPRFSKGTSAPVLVDLGRKRGKQLKQLKRGEGPLVDELADVIEQVREQLAGDLEGKTILPVVLIYERRRKSSWSALAGM